MNRWHKALALVALSQIVPAMVRAAPLEQLQADTSQAFDAQPVGDELLGSIVGGQRSLFTREMRGITDAGTLGTLQQVGQTSRIALDTWWSQTGAALIANNLIAQPVQ